METVTTSGKYKLDWRDAAKGALVAALTIIITMIGQVSEAWLDAWVKNTPFVLNKVSIALSLKLAAATFISYLAKNLFTPQQVIVKGNSLPETTPEVTAIKVEEIKAPPPTT